MKKSRYLLVLFSFIFIFSESLAETRFFKANSVRIKYVFFEIEYVPLGSSSEYSYPGLGFAELWTGNDTIVDGYPCVTLWDQIEGEDPVLIGYVREDENGYVWRYYMDFNRFYYTGGDYVFLEAMGIVNDWAFLYDFSNPDWQVGTCFLLARNAKSPQTSTIPSLETVTTENGEELPKIEHYGYIYGIGDPTRPFECYAAIKYMMYKLGVLEYWRDGELLLKNYGLLTEEEWAFITKIKQTTSTLPDGPFYDLQGRPADGTQKGIYIRNGKKVLVR